MRFLALRLLPFVAALLLALAPGLAGALPPYTPDVVDPGHVLDADATATVNAELQRIREHGIAGAVYLVDTLDGLPIEGVAKEAIAQWQIGSRSGDNGLLLVLAIRDRQSRLQVGRALQGAIPDRIASHALQQYVAPRMRDGDTAGAIVESFAYLARVVGQDPDALRETETADGDEFVWKRGLVAWGVMAAVVWLTLPIRDAWMRERRARLELAEPGLLRDGGGLFGGSVPSSNPAAMSFWGRVGLKAFLTINPGVFVLIGASLSALAYHASIVLSLLVMVLMVTVPLRKLASPAAYRAFLGKRDRQRTEMIAKGHLLQTAAGTFVYTQAYHDSVRASSSDGSGSSSFSSSSSSSSSSSDSSSSGGSSGTW